MVGCVVSGRTWLKWRWIVSTCDMRHAPRTMIGVGFLRVPAPRALMGSGERSPDRTHSITCAGSGVLSLIFSLRGCSVGSSQEKSIISS